MVETSNREKMLRKISYFTEAFSLSFPNHHITLMSKSGNLTAEKFQFVDKFSLCEKRKKQHLVLIVVAQFEYGFTSNITKQTQLQVDDNLASPRHRASPLHANSTPMAELDSRNPNSLTRKGLTCYDCCYYTAPSDRGAAKMLTKTLWGKTCVPR